MHVCQVMYILFRQIVAAAGAMVAHFSDAFEFLYNQSQSQSKWEEKKQWNSIKNICDPYSTDTVEVRLMKAFWELKYRLLNAPFMQKFPKQFVLCSFSLFENLLGFIYSVVFNFLEVLHSAVPFVYLCHHFHCRLPHYILLLLRNACNAERTIGLDDSETMSTRKTMHKKI